MFYWLDLEHWDRREIFEHFWQADCSYSITQELEATSFLNYLEVKGLRFFPSFTWTVLTAINHYPQFRMGFDPQGRLGYFDVVHPEYAVLNERTKNVDSLLTLYHPSFHQFCTSMIADIDRYKALGLRNPPRDDSLLISCTPWFHYTALSCQMKSNHFFLRPMITWGRYLTEGARAHLPFTIQVHHAAADGYHCALLLEEIQQILTDPGNYLGY